MLGLKREINADGSIMFRIISISQYINMYANCEATYTYET